MVSLIVAVSALLSLAAAVPIQDGIRSGLLEARQAPNCNIGTQTDNATLYDSACWNALNIMPYLTNWKATTPTCTDAESSAGQTLGCCVASEPWSTCFLRLATRKLGAYDCTQLTASSCSFPAELDPGLDPTIVAQVNYIVLNIMMINQFFSSYYTALQSATALVESETSSLVSDSASNPLNPSKVQINRQNMIAAVTLGLVFPEFSTPKFSTVSNDGTTTLTSVSKRDAQNCTTGSESGGANGTVTLHSWLAAYYQSGRHHRRQESDCPSQTSVASSSSVPVALLPLDSGSAPVVISNQALQQSPNVASAMWPSTLNPATVAVGGVVLDFTDCAKILNPGLQLIMNDVGTFIAFAGNGLFSTPLAPVDLATTYSSGFTRAYVTYVVTAILASNHIYAIPGSIGTTPCKNVLSTNLCSSSYWSPVTGRQYTFSGAQTESFLSYVVQSTEADLGVLFDGAYNCTYEGLAGGSVVNLKADKSLDVACLSMLPIYITGDCPDGATYVNGKCPFGHIAL